MADDKEGERDILSVQLLLRKGNQPYKISMREHPNASLPLRSLCSGCCYIR
jgi:hypothetical protein